MRVLQMTMHRHLPMPVMLAVLVSWFWTLPAGATQITVNGGVDEHPGIGTCSSIYSDLTNTQTSLSGSTTSCVGFASSSGDLATGELKAFAHSAPSTVQNGVLSNGPNEGVGTVQLRETIHIQGIISAPVTGLVTAALDGTLVPDALFEAFVQNSPSAMALFQLAVNGDPCPFSQYDFVTRGCPPGGVVGMPPGQQSCVNTTTIHSQVSVPFVISDHVRDFEIVANLSAQSLGGGLADVSHTAGLGLTLPAGLSFTSDSGVFLTQSPSAAPSTVPEPGTVALLSTGLVGLLGYGWRQRKRAALAAS